MRPSTLHALFKRMSVSMAVLLGIVLLGSSELKAQQAMPCDTASVLLTNEGQTAARLEEAASTIVGCGDMAPTTIAKALRTALSGTVRDSAAQYAAWFLADRRLIDSVAVLGKDASQTVSKRRAFLKLLARYVVPSAAVYTENAQGASDYVLGVLSDADVVDGNQPITASDRARALDAIVWMGVNDPNLDVRRVANLAGAQLAEWLASGG
jgi:hypothetical protein